MGGHQNAREHVGVAFGPAILPRGFEAGTNGQVSWLETGWLFLPSAEAPVDVSLSKPFSLALHRHATRKRSL